MFRRYLSLVLLLLCAINASAFYKSSYSNQIFDCSVNVISQDSRGFVWAGSSNGLLCFVGCDYERYDLDTSLYGQGCNRINALAHINDSLLMVATANGLFWFDIFTGSFTPFELKSEKDVGVDGEVSAIVCDAEGLVWIKSQSNGIFCYDENEQKLILYPLPVETDISTTPVSLAVDINGTLWCTTGNSDIFRFDNQSDSFVSQSVDLGDFADDCITGVFTVADSESLYIGTRYKGLYGYNLSTDSVSLYSGNTNNMPVGIRAVALDLNGELIIASDNGLWRLNRKTGNYKIISHCTGDTQLSYSAVMADSQGGMWIGSVDAGLVYCQPFFDISDSCFLPSVVDHTIAGKNLRVMATSHYKNKVWVGCSNNSILLFDYQNNCFESTVISVPNAIVNTLCDDGQSLWAGSLNNSCIYRFEGFSQAKMTVYEVGNGVNKIGRYCSINSIAQMKDGRLIAGGTNGLFVFSADNSRFEPLDWVDSNDITGIEVDKQGYVWICSNASLYCYDPSSATTTQYLDNTKYYNDQQPNMIPTLDAGGGLYVFLEDLGIFRFDYRKHAFEQIDVAIDNNISTITNIIVDNRDNLWLGSCMGLRCVDKDNSCYFTDNKNYLVKGAALRTDTGKLLFGFVNGIHTIRTADNIHPADSSRLWIRNLSVNGKLVSAKNRTKYEGERIVTFEDQIKLTHNEGLIEFDIVSGSFVSPLHNKIRYKLEGCDNDWITANGMTHVVYNLKNGRYKLRMVGVGSDGVAYDNEKIVNIVVKPPFYLSNICLYIFFLLCLLGFLLFWIRRDIVSNQQKKLIAYKLTKDNEAFESKISFFTSIVHEIRTPLSLIKAPLDEIIQSTDSSSPTMNNLMIMQRNTERLHVLVNQLLDFRRMDGSHKALMEVANIRASDRAGGSRI